MCFFQPNETYIIDLKKYICSQRERGPHNLYGLFKTINLLKLKNRTVKSIRN